MNILYNFCIYSLLNPAGYSTRKEMIDDIIGKETQEVRDIRVQEYIKITEKEMELTDKYYGNTYEYRLQEKLRKASMCNYIFEKIKIILEVW